MKAEVQSVIPDKKVIRSFRDKIIRWFDKNARKYPWRETNDPFRVLIAEMMLRRTKADQVKEVHDRLFSEYPDVQALADADGYKIEEILYPLGLKWRVPAFSLIAKDIKEKYESKVPDKREKLKELPGVGDYVAGAVLSIAYGKKEWIVDSNIVRLVRRYFGIATSKEGRRDKHVIEIAKIYSDYGNPRQANLAILDFSALVCRPKNPLCNNCTLIKNCSYEDV